MSTRKGWIQVMPAGPGGTKLKPVPKVYETAPPPPPPAPPLPPQSGPSRHGGIPPPPGPPPPPTLPRRPPPLRVPSVEPPLMPPRAVLEGTSSKSAKGPVISAPIFGEEAFDPTLRMDAMGGPREDPNNTPCRDFFFDSDKVLSLNSDNFTTFLTRKDATMVMFYNDKFPESQEFQKIFSEAASNTKRENHAFVGVDCRANVKLCKANGICKYPVVRLYSKSFCIGEMKCLNTVSADMLRQYVEFAPVSDESRTVQCRLLAK